MSKYTTSIETIINSQSNHSYDIYERIETGRKFLFDFEYLVPNADFKKSFETQFIEKYWQECIGYETVPLFKMKLKQRLEMLMPEICFKYDALDKIIKLENPSLERFGSSKETGENHSTNYSKNVANSTVDGSGTSKSKDIVSDLPASVISADTLGEVTHASNGGMNEGSNTSKSKGNSNSTTNGNDDSNHSIERTFEEYGNQLNGYNEWYNSYHNLMNELLISFDDMFIQLLF